jgi:hypothetical protein
MSSEGRLNNGGEVERAAIVAAARDRGWYGRPKPGAMLGIFVCSSADNWEGSTISPVQRVDDLLMLKPKRKVWRSADTPTGIAVRPADAHRIVGWLLQVAKEAFPKVVLRASTSITSCSEMKSRQVRDRKVARKVASVQRSCRASGTVPRVRGMICR